MNTQHDQMRNKIEIQYGTGLLSRFHSFSVSVCRAGGESPFSRHISLGTSSTCTYKTKKIIIKKD